MLRFFVLSPLLCALLCSCAGTDGAPPQKLIAQMFVDAYELADKGDFDGAGRAFVEIESTYPADVWAAKALVNAAYSQYMADDFAGAITTIDRFMRFHPGHRDADYVMYLRGMCFYRQVSDVRREPGMSAHAFAAFSQLAQRFPKSEYAKNAENKMVILKNYMAGKLMYSARRDLRRQNYAAAITGLQKVLTQFGETNMAPEAMFRLTEAYKAIGLHAQTAGYAAMLRLNFPASEWAGKLK